MSLPPGAKRRGRARDRHGRGPRGPLATHDIPLSRSRAETFLDTVDDAIEHLAGRWARELEAVDFAVEEVPEAEPAGDDELADSSGVPLARVLRRTGGRSRIVVYRRPLELRAGDPAELADYVHDVVVEAVAKLLGLDPDTVDPGYFD